MSLSYGIAVPKVNNSIKLGDKLSANDVLRGGYGTVCPHCLMKISPFKNLDLYDYDCGMCFVYGNSVYEVTGLCNTLKVDIKEKEQCVVSECSCDLFSVLMIRGCNCGFLEQERKMKGKN